VPGGLLEESTPRHSVEGIPKRLLMPIEGAEMKIPNPKLSPESLPGEANLRVPSGSYSLSKIRWCRVLGAAFAVVALSFLLLMVIVTAYAFVLAFQARGAPDQIAINHFAASVSRGLMPWLEMVLTLLLAFRVARRTEGARLISGLIVGILAGLLSLAVTLAFGGRLGLHNTLFLLIVVALGWLGGFIGQKTVTFARHNAPRG
jgi:hypothetical protein